MEEAARTNFGLCAGSPAGTFDTSRRIPRASGGCSSFRIGRFLFANRIGVIVRDGIAEPDFR